MVRIDRIGCWRRTHYSNEIGPELDRKEIVIFGWVRDIRDLGGIRFIILQDKEGTVQITIPRDEVDGETLRKGDALQGQYCIGVKGTVREMDRAPSGAEIIPQEIRILGVAKQPLPIDLTGKTPADIDVRLDARVIDLRRDENQAIFRIRDAVLKATRGYLSTEGFVEVNTPKIIATATEGGASLFPVAYFEKEAFLAQSPQLYKEQLVVDFEKVFEIGPAYRAEKSHTRRHVTEFVSIDIEEAFATAQDVMKVSENLMRHVCMCVKEKYHTELKALGHDVVVPEVPLGRFTYDEVLQELAEKGIDVTLGEDLPTPAFRMLGKIHPYFYFIVDWPSSLKPFYIKPRDDKPEISEGFDLMWSWIEIASGGTRVHEKDLLIKRLVEQGLHPESFKYHLQAFDYGMPPHAGWAIGLERVVMMLTGKKNIREVILFPRDRFRLTP
ncbi:MAG: aspartate--tRNA(Asn) ligase [Candidatus Bathyarchaeota archaeon]|nr:aspartate--tRNA(Asn) ligase [Candidatus Bathyarchaeota archaeon]